MTVLRLLEVGVHQLVFEGGSRSLVKPVDCLFVVALVTHNFFPLRPVDYGLHFHLLGARLGEVLFALLSEPGFHLSPSHSHCSGFFGFRIFLENAEVFLHSDLSEPLVSPRSTLALEQPVKVEAASLVCHITERRWCSRFAFVRGLLWARPFWYFNPLACFYDQVLSPVLGLFLSVEVLTQMSHHVFVLRYRPTGLAHLEFFVAFLLAAGYRRSRVQLVSNWAQLASVERNFAVSLRLTKRSNQRIRL